MSNPTYPASNQVIVYKDDKFNNDKDYPNYTRTFNSSCSDLSEVHWKDKDNGTHGSDNVSEDIGSMRIGNSCYVTAYTDFNFGGTAGFFEYTTESKGEYRDLDDYHMTCFDGKEHNWDNKIKSLSVTSVYPGVNRHTLVENWRKQFNEFYPVNDNPKGGGVDSLDNPYLDVHAQDASYKVYYPQISFSEYSETGDNGVTHQKSKLCVTVRVNHTNGTTSEDAEITFSLDEYGNYYDDVSISYSHDSVSVPDWMIELTKGTVEAATDALIAVLDLAEELATEGAATPLLIPEDKAIKLASKALCFGIDHINTVIKRVNKFTEDGGSLYFLNFVTHVLDRTLNACLATIYKSDTGDGDVITLDRDNVINSLNLPPDAERTYSKKTGHKDSNVEYYYEGLQYTLWKPDVTSLYNQGGMMCSCKLDADNSGKDNHLNLTAMFDPGKNLMSLQGSISYYNPDVMDDYPPPNSGVITYRINDDGTRSIVRLNQDGSVTAMSQGSLKSAFLASMNTDLDRFRKEVGESVSNHFSANLMNLPYASEPVIDGFIASVR
ncbi:MAG: hypothetical protein R3F02_19685 [Thiolinea sp.]